jgi:hypothetical protein
VRGQPVAVGTVIGQQRRRMHDEDRQRLGHGADRRWYGAGRDL